MTDAHFAPSFTHTRMLLSRKMRRVMDRAERRVEVTNPDGTTTVHTFWTDSHYDALAWPDEEGEPGSELV